MTTIDLRNADCLDALPAIPAASIDLVLADLPYGTTKCKWDSVIDLDVLWPELMRVIKPGRAIVLTANQPFTSALVMSNPAWFKHEWIWDKVTGRGHLVAKKRPMQQHESVLVFGKGGVLYNPQMVLMDKPQRGRAMEASRTEIMGGRTTREQQTVVRTHKYPKTIQTFSMDKRYGHPTQKPVALFEYLIRTYSNPGDVVLDVTAGSGTTAVAALNTSRSAICIEKDPGYFEMMQERTGLAGVPHAA